MYNPDFDSYIEQAQDFAKPILEYIRELVHEVCPECEEKLKWGMPFFDYKGVMCHMGAFKNHASFSFWKANIMKDPYKVMKKYGENSSMGNFGKILSIDDLPERDILIEYINEAIDLNVRGVKLPQKPKKDKPLNIPEYIIEALQSDELAIAAFNEMSKSHKREYVEWIEGAKREETKERRIKKAIEMLSEGLSLNYKYEKK